MTYKEFNLITHYFKRSKNLNKSVILGIGDDCALLSLKEKQLLAISTDTLVSGTHFFPNIDPMDLSYKALAVNISDLAAMGANPAWVLLSLTLPKINKNWLKRFSDSFYKNLNFYKIELIGGDITRGPLSITLTIHGLIPIGKELTRGGAQIGDWIYVTGTLGDSAAGLAIIENRLKIKNKQACKYLIDRHLRPKPRILQGQAIRSLATSAIDISDGLIVDLKHILKSSTCGASINLNNIPQSKILKSSVDTKQALYWGLTGGEDYELCFTIPDTKRYKLISVLKNYNTRYTCIGQIIKTSEGIVFYHYNKKVEFSYKGFEHFCSNKNNINKQL
ncbi:Thiamine-monophosphate kinase [Candidatus Ecksteinia adelgidicola]|nr:Thiamine-monophosphate kinase [Candidatus Ecksteinia adelgidicola]